MYAATENCILSYALHLCGSLSFIYRNVKPQKLGRLLFSMSRILSIPLLIIGVSYQCYKHSTSMVLFCLDPNPPCPSHSCQSFLSSFSQAHAVNRRVQRFAAQPHIPGHFIYAKSVSFWLCQSMQHHTR